MEGLPSCTGCKHLLQFEDKEGNILNKECLRYPPNVQLFMVPPKIEGAPPQVMKQQFFPNASIRCGEYSEGEVALTPLNLPNMEKLDG